MVWNLARPLRHNVLNISVTTLSRFRPFKSPAVWNRYHLSSHELCIIISPPLSHLVSLITPYVKIHFEQSGINGPLSKPIFAKSVTMKLTKIGAKTKFSKKHEIPQNWPKMKLPYIGQQTKSP